MTVCVTACTVPFFLDPVMALRSAGPVATRSIDLCVSLTVCFLAGIAACVCGDTAASVAFEVLLMPNDFEIPPSSRVRTILGFTRSSGQDAVAAGCALVGGVCVCELTAPRGAEADALAGIYGVMPDSSFFLYSHCRTARTEWP